MDNKVYSPQVIPDQPYPVGTDTTVPTGGNGTKQVTNPFQLTDTHYPNRPIAGELLSVALNTKSKKILQEFVLSQNGGLQAGSYEPGVSGDVRITPAGIVARNQAGETTLGIDADTGDAVFQGTVQARDFVVADENGLVSVFNFQTDEYNATNTVTLTGVNSATDVAGSELQFELLRDTQIYISFFANGKLYATDPFRGYNLKVYLAIDGVTQNNPAVFEVDRMNSDLGACVAKIKSYLLGPGVHKIKMQWSTFGDVTATFELKGRGLDYTILGS